MVRCRVSLCAGLLAAVALQSGARAEEPFSFASTPGQLPKTVVPSAYRISVRPDLKTLRFRGQEQVDVIVSQPARTIVLNAVDLRFERVTMLGVPGPPATVALDPKARTARLDFGKTIAPGKHTLAIRYSGPVTLAPSGLYYNDYDAATGRKRMLVTQFESIDARRMFPGWDEPAFKATYTLSATLPAGLAVISNTPIVRQVSAGSDASGAAHTTTTFAATPKMSSYLLVLVAGDLRSVSADADGTKISVWSRSGKENLGNAALADASELLPYYNAYFGVTYPLPKLDLIAVPGNFAAGAMENWGGITFIDNALLFDPAKSTPATRQSVFGVIAHEMAHQWSGDLVTMAWWNNTWLNEGFASWMAAKAGDHFNPSWNVWLRERGSKNFAMGLDARKTTHPIQQEIAAEDDIGRAFDPIEYQKGEAFLRMLETYLGEDTFRAGMRAYMAKHAYSNATTADLWAALEAASGKPVAQIAAGFTEQPGVPLLIVNTSCSAGKTTVALAQDRFTISDLGAAKLTWQIPVRIAAFGPSGPPAVHALIVPPGGAQTSFDGCDLAVSANNGDTGYYRVAYDPSSLRRLQAAFHSLPATDRAALVSDQYALVQSGRAPLSTYLALLNALGGEREYAVWSQALSALNSIDTLENGSRTQAAFRTYARSILAPQLERLGFDPRASDSDGEALLRNDLILALGRFDDPDTIVASRARFAAFLQDPSSLPPSISGGVLTTVGAHADQAAWDQLHALGKSASGTELKLRYYYALAAARAPSLIDQSVNLATANELPNGRVNRFLIQAAAASGDPERVFDDVALNFAAITKGLEPGQTDGLMPSIVQTSVDPRLAEKLAALPSSSANPAARYNVRLAESNVADNASLKALILPQVSAWTQANPVLTGR